MHPRPMITWQGPDDERIRQLLRATRVVAVVGASDNPARPSHGVLRYLLQHTGWTVYPVNPNADTVAGVAAYPSLADLPRVPDLVDVFRRGEQVPGVAEEAARAGARVLWLQLGLWDIDVARRWQAGGEDHAVVMDRCLKVEHAALLGPTGG